eukprot:SAG11_NODE_1911_length_4079_cov_1.842462_2_plen_85_part_00
MACVCVRVGAWVHECVGTCCAKVICSWISLPALAQHNGSVRELAYFHCPWRCTRAHTTQGSTAEKALYDDDVDVFIMLVSQKCA